MKCFASCHPSLHQTHIKQARAAPRMDVLSTVRPPLGILIADLDGTRPREAMEQISLYTSSQQL